VSSLSPKPPAVEGGRSSSGPASSKSSDTDALVRFNQGRKCPICGGAEGDRRGQGQRCAGFIAGEWIHCSREEHAGHAKYHQGSQTWSHKAQGPCPCGVEHLPRRQAGGRLGKRGKIDRVYDYCDESGQVVHQTVRFAPKDFRQRRPIGKGRYEWNLSGINVVLYRLRELREAGMDQTVWIVEGEKDADRLAGLHLVATTNPMGALKWSMVDSSPLAGRRCVVLADNDDSGRKHAQQVAADLYGKAASVKVLELPGVPEHGDVSDWLGQGGNVQQLRALADAAAAWSPDSTYGPFPSSNGNGKHATTDVGLRSYAALTALTNEELGLTAASTIQVKPIDWLWKYRLAAGEFSLMAGEPGLGKSQAMLAIAAAITTGSEWPGGTGIAPTGSVIILSAEDSPETTIIPRLRAMNANLEKVQILRAKAVRKRDGKESVILPMSFKDLDWWRLVFDRVPDARMLIADPVVSYLGKGVNDQRNTEIREILEPFIEDVIRSKGICFLGNTHLNKSIDSKSPLNRISGSTAYGALPRNVHFVVKDPDNPKQRYLKQCKSNNAPDDLEAIPFHLEQRVLHIGQITIETSVPIFADKGIDLDLQKVLGGDKGKRGPVPVKTNEVAEWLFTKLGEAPLMMRDLVEQAQEAGFVHPPTERHPKPSIAILYDAFERVSQLHPGYRVEQSTVEAGVGVGRKPRKRWSLVRPDGEPAGTDKPPF
jgi:putative DNA primase/helicase